jgi:hypothetical protein
VKKTQPSDKTTSFLSVYFTDIGNINSNWQGKKLTADYQYVLKNEEAHRAYFLQKLCKRLQ